MYAISLFVIFDYIKKENIKINSSIDEIPVEFNFPNWIITDLRFPNELQAIKDRGGITIRVNRPVENYPENHKFNGDTQSAIKIAHNHPSETALDNATFDYTIINDGSIEELIEKVKEILTKNQLI